MFSSLSVIIPAYNESDRISETLEDVIVHLPRFAHVYEVIVIDDGSHDATAESVRTAATALGANHIVRVITIPHGGKGKAVQAGVNAAVHEWILFMDADNSARISAIVRLLPWIDTYPIVIGSRAILDSSVTRQEVRYRHWIGKLYNWFMRFILDLHFSDTQCGYKLFRRAEGKSLFAVLAEKGFAFDTEILYHASRANILVKEVAIDWTMSKRSSVNVARDGARMFLALLRIRWRTITQQKKALVFLLVFFCLLVGSFIYRAQSLHFSLPDGSIFGHTRSYFNDEDAVVADTAKLIATVKKHPLGIFDPEPTVYPVFGNLLSAVPLGFQYVLHYRGMDIGELMTASPQTQTVFYSLIASAGRLVSFLAAFLAILLFYALCRELGVPGKIAAFLALVYAWMPVDILMSIEAKSNALLNLLLLGILWLCLRFIRTRQDALLLWATLLTGMAFGTRLNGILAGFIPLVTLLFAYRGRIHRFFLSNKKNVLIFFLPFIGALVSSPHLLAHPSYIFRMWSRAGSGSLIFSLDMEWINIFHTLRLIAGGWAGLPLLVCTFGYAVYAIWKLSLPHKIVASWFFFYLLIFIQTAVPIVRYAYPLLPLWLLLFGSLLASRRWPVWTKRAGWIIISGWVAAVFVFGAAYVSLFRERPLEHVVNEFVEKNVPAGASIGTYYNEKFYTRVPINYETYRIFSCRDLEEGKRTQESYPTRPEYLVVSMRSGQACMSRVFGLGTADYTLETVFSQPLAFGPFHFLVEHAGAYYPDIFAVYRRTAP